MKQSNSLTPPIEVIDEHATFSLTELCRCCSVEAEHIKLLVEYGILEPAGKQEKHWYFCAGSVKRTRITLNLQRDLGVNLEGAALALDLLDRIDELDARLRVLSG
ncbi:MAG: chaperone modulator CbpM [Alteromonas sp.]|jgi:chaperone modulatory protein CbpM|uniref:chaperone modulator CbpM n=1 Tax=Alteromonas sp. TaxID=232 RepID=UPI0032D8BFB2